MANFEGKLNLNVETSEIEIKGKFKLSEEELDGISAGVSIPLGSEEPAPNIIWHTIHNVSVGTIYSYEATFRCPVCGSTMNVQLGGAQETYSCPDSPKFVLKVLANPTSDRYCEVVSSECS